MVMVQKLKTVTLYQDFKEDKRTSIDIFSDFLETYLLKFINESYKIYRFQPKIPSIINKLPDKINLRMRAARYIGYPLQAKKSQGEINHIMEEGYGHLLYTLDPNRTVVSVHDLIPMLAWNNEIPGMTYSHRPRLAEFSFKALSRARKIIANSHSTKNDLIRLCNINPDKINVIYQGLDPEFHNVSINNKQIPRQMLNFPDCSTHLILITGQQEYKNHKTCLKVIEGLQEISRKPVQLVRLGRKTMNWDQQIKKANLKNFPICLQNLPRKEVIEVYKAVDCLLFPSWYEGFGRPPLEAMACGTPVVTSNRASLPEVVGNAGLIADADNVNELTNKVNRILTDDVFYQDLVEKGKKRSTSFTWESTVKQLMHVYESISSS
ncbi:glycosyltransferase family 4 protein [Desulfohalobium retbaense]|uniref:Glycosyl transferase group 1 n=1 Tax=Desulfohalobium retbaense (strain ATCC 49708 / DSM 5692 / JCM 16813 / HR100) TaxID=485915 RepID=C8X053_DESRD|nr:glycosyltransferase family 1 protein [Desulfohalobium retbaense]ACV67678.1 glycosyl transferase group 1 [Desulfohalobium retbaense DSM 5692]